VGGFLIYQRFTRIASREFKGLSAKNINANFDFKLINFVEGNYTDCHSDKCISAECHYATCLSAKYRPVKCCSTKCRSAECRGAAAAPVFDFQSQLDIISFSHRIAS
jgi:hypothetical protein